MLGSARLMRMSITAAMSAPVQAPVPGRGMPTKTARPKNWYFRTLSHLPSALASSFETRRPSRSLLFVIHLKMGRMNKMMKGTGSMLPSILTHMASKWLRPSPTPRGMAPRSSMTGIMVTISVTKYAPKSCPVSRFTM